MITKTRVGVVAVVAAGSLLLAACGGSSSAGSPVGDPDVVLASGQSAVFTFPPKLEVPNVDGLIRSGTSNQSLRVTGSTLVDAVEFPESPVYSYPEILPYKTPDESDTSADGEASEGTSGSVFGASEGNKLQVVKMETIGRIGKPANESASSESDSGGVTETLRINGVEYPLPTVEEGSNYLVVSVPDGQTPDVRFHEIENVVQDLNLATGEKAAGYPAAYYLNGFQMGVGKPGYVSATTQEKYDLKFETLTPVYNQPDEWRNATSVTVAIPEVQLTYWQGQTFESPSPHASNPNQAFLFLKPSLDYNGFGRPNGVPLKNITLKDNTGKTYPAKITPRMSLTEIIDIDRENYPSGDGELGLHFDVPATIKSGTITINVPKNMKDNNNKSLPVRINNAKPLTFTFTMPQ